MKDRIFQLMKYQGMSQKEFAATLCIAEGTLSGIYTGRTRPTNNIVNAIHECFPHISINWLMFGEGEMLIDGSSPQQQDATSGQLNLFSSDSTPSSEVNSIPTPAPQIQEVVKYIDKPQRKITEIRVFYDDGTFETFSSK